MTAWVAATNTTDDGIKETDRGSATLAKGPKHPLTSEVFTFWSDLGKQVLCGALPTG